MLYEVITPLRPDPAGTDRLDCRKFGSRKKGNVRPVRAVFPAAGGRMETVRGDPLRADGGGFHGCGVPDGVSQGYRQPDSPRIPFLERPSYNFV